MKKRFVGFEALKRAVSMSQVLDRYSLWEQLRRSGDSLSGACPLHNGHNRTQFRVSLSRNCWNCFGDCHAGGSIIDFVSRKENVGIREAALLIQDWFNVGPLDARKPCSRNGNGYCPNNDAPAIPDVERTNPPLQFELRDLDYQHPYLTARGLSRTTIETFGIGYCRTGWLSGWIAIPIHNATGDLVAYAGRWPGPPPEGLPKYRQPKGFRKSLELFNLHRAKEADESAPLVVVEGFFGCMLVWQAGYRRVVALMGSSLSHRQQQLLVSAAGPQGRIVVMFDEDEAGRRGRAEAQSRLASQIEVKAIQFALPGTQPDQLPAGRLLEILRKESGVCT